MSQAGNIAARYYRSVPSIDHQRASRGSKNQVWACFDAMLGGRSSVNRRAESTIVMKFERMSPTAWFPLTFTKLRKLLNVSRSSRRFPTVSSTVGGTDS